MQYLFVSLFVYIIFTHSDRSRKKSAALINTRTAAAVSPAFAELRELKPLSFSEILHEVSTQS